MNFPKPRKENPANSDVANPFPSPDGCYTSMGPDCRQVARLQRRESPGEKIGEPILGSERTGRYDVFTPFWYGAHSWRRHPWRLRSIVQRCH